MCRRVECASCGKPTFSGCGQHVEQVLGSVPREDRCGCREISPREPPQAERQSLLGRLFGR